jgi:hypothetical protein
MLLTWVLRVALSVGARDKAPTTNGDHLLTPQLELENRQVLTTLGRQLGRDSIGSLRIAFTSCAPDPISYHRRVSFPRFCVEQLETLSVVLSRPAVLFKSSCQSTTTITTHRIPLRPLHAILQRLDTQPDQLTHLGSHPHSRP